MAYLRPMSRFEVGRIVGTLCAGVVALVVLVGALFVVFPDRKTQEIERAPGRDLVFPLGDLLARSRSTSVFNWGADEGSTYGTNATAEQVIGWFDAELGKLGYAPTAPTVDEHLLDLAHTIRQYRNGPYVCRLFLVRPPVRVGGRTLTREYERVLMVSISNWSFDEKGP
jgi:hypothetical protein